MQFLKAVLVGAGISILTATRAVCAELPAAGTPLLGTDTLAAFQLSGSQRELGKLQTVPVDGQPFKQALRVTTDSAPASETNLQIIAPTLAGVKTGDVVMIRFWLRCTDSMTGEGFTTFVFEESHPEFDKGAEIRVSSNSQWRECDVPFKAMHDFPSGQTRVCFRAGFDRQTIEIGGLEVFNLGPDAKLESLPRTRITYPGREANAAWRKEALARIEDIRKGNLTVQVTDGAGNAVSDATVHVVLTRHEFGFGSCVTADLLTGTTPDCDRYRQLVESMFNLAVFENDMKWPAVYDGVPPKVDKALGWLLARHIQVRGHNLVWPSERWLPTQLKAMHGDPDKLREATDTHITNTVSHFRGKLIQWDVVNEPFKNHDLIDVLGKSAVIDWFNLAHQADPQCKLYLNEYGIVDSGATDSEHQDNFYNWIKYLKDNGAPINGIGIQSHFGSVLTDPARILKVFDRFSDLGLPIESTELSINLDDRQLQADYMRDYMIAAFSHPNIHGIMLWGFWEKRHWRPQSALFAADWSVRPIGQAWMDLVQHEWKTDAVASTDVAGAATLRGFCGDYEVTVTRGSTSKKSVSHLSHDGTRLVIVLN